MDLSTMYLGYQLKNCFTLVAALSLLLLPVSTFAQRLKLSENKRYVVTNEGKPFFYLGDTAWELFHRLNREEADLYLKDRATKGFTVIQAVVLAELSGLKEPNPYGHLPLQNNDPAQPNEAYFEHVDYIVDRAQELGLYIGMLPTWGDKVLKGWPGGGPEIFTPANAQVYGEFLGKRYKDKPIIWILGGDRNILTDEHRAIWQAMAQGIKKGDAGNHLITYHPMGPGNSSKWFHQDAWLDFNMVQSGHSRVAYPNDSIIEVNYTLTPVKPTLDGEPRYEDHPINWKPEIGWFTDFDVRQAAYSAILAGAFGHTYGNHNIWQMWHPGRNAISHARTPWQQALQQPGAVQMGYMRSLFESRPWQQLLPDQAIISGENLKGISYMRAARADNFFMVYIPTGKAITVDTQKLSGKRTQAWWFNCRTGKAQLIDKSKRTQQTLTFDPPGEEGPGNDWVLVLDNAKIKFPAPGEPSK